MSGCKRLLDVVSGDQPQHEGEENAVKHSMTLQQNGTNVDLLLKYLSQTHNVILSEIKIQLFLYG